jgi:hypothetical protein
MNPTGFPVRENAAGEQLLIRQAIFFKPFRVFHHSRLFTKEQRLCKMGAQWAGGKHGFFNIESFIKNNLI